MNRAFTFGCVALLAGGLLVACASADEAAPARNATAEPSATAPATSFEPGVDGPVLASVIEAQSEGSGLRGSLAKDISEYLPNVRFAFEDGSPDLQFGGVGVGTVGEVAPLAAFTYANGPAGEEVPFEDDKAQVRFAVVTVLLDEGWLPKPAKEVKVAVRLAPDKDPQSQLDAIQNDWGTAVAVLGRPFSWSGVEVPDVFFPGLFQAGLGRVSADGQLRFDGLDEAVRETVLNGVTTVEALRAAATAESRVITLPNPSSIRSELISD